MPAEGDLRRRPGSGGGVLIVAADDLAMTPKLEIADLTKRFPARRAALALRSPPRTAAGGLDRGPRWLEVLSRVSLRVGQREFVSLLGPSGCGKSTLCNIVAGLILPDRGQVLLDGTPIGPRRGQVAYMQQKDLLLPWRRVIDNAILGLEVQGVPRPEARDEARDLLRRFGLGGFEGYYPAVLSGGMRQRVALVRTLLCRKDVIVLDEPFGALDAMTRAAMRGYLLQLVDEFDRTILFITHDVEEAILLSDRIYVMTARPGRIRAEIAVPLARPRDPAHETVVRTKTEIMAVLQAEMTEAFS
jgi:ABC-type nitrate/sulfonate/bicarbonate transport system ATPase subunit